MNPNGVHHTELPEAKPDEALAKEWNTYRREVGRWLSEGQEGRFVLIKGEEILGLYESWNEARQAGLNACLSGPFFVHCVRPVEPLLCIRGINYPWPSSHSQ